ncbi:MAG: RluA family pseudouridine synthase [Pirellulales bacterium]|nr:RluA family pseudouridine synthase [Pirellulales bacterium]
MPPDRAGYRLDVFLAEQFPAVSRATVRRAIDAGHVRVDDHEAKPSHRLENGHLVCVRQLDVPREGPEPQEIALDIVHEDESIIVVNKPAGMVVHPAKGHWKGTLASALAHHFGQLSTRGGATRPGIVHRLDRDTTGVIVVAKNNEAHDILAAQFKSRVVKKEYLAIVVGVPELDRDQIDEPIGDHPTHREKKAIRRQDPAARPATTEYEVLERFQGFALLRALPKTGRTHQIRLHLAHIRHPILCDRLYGGRAILTELELIPRGQLGQDTPASQEAAGRALLDRHALHAHRLRLRHPMTDLEMEFVAPLPADVEATLAALRRWRCR